MPNPPPAPAWRDVLDRIDLSLRECMVRAAEPDPAGPPAERPVLDLLDSRFARLRARLEQAEQEAARAEAEVSAEVQALESWLRETAALRQRLPAVAGGAPAA
jgi:hypothetical protein